MNNFTILGTPIGNIEDISLRALRAILTADIVLAEDTRTFIKLKNILKERYVDLIKTLNIEVNNNQNLISYREQNHDRVFPEILNLILQGKSVILTTDAGLPVISDPGYLLIKELYNNNITPTIIPSPTSITSSIALSGLKSDKFTFLGFLPRDRGKIRKVINESLLNNVSSIVFFESPFRVLKTLILISELNSEINVACVNDITKKFEKVFRGNILDVINQLKDIKIVGEWVIVIEKTKD